MRTIRSFIAVNIGVSAVRAVADEQARLRRATSARGVQISWVAPQNLHVTLAFLGQVTEPMVAAIEDGIEPIARKLAPFELVAKGLGVFPDAEHPRVVWVGLDDAGGNLAQLHASISEVLGRMGFDIDDKPFRSHVTLGRVKGGDAEALAACLAAVGGRVYGAFTVRDIACYRSDLRPTGADYDLLWHLPLGARPRGVRAGEMSQHLSEDQEPQDETPFMDDPDEGAEEYQDDSADDGANDNANDDEMKE